ncbi:MAG: hypothetical protein K6G56_01980 [Clostridiales bacterium]|nr:hypothetical protein [Clostridiales bacterium]
MDKDILNELEEEQLETILKNVKDRSGGRKENVKALFDEKTGLETVKKAGSRPGFRRIAGIAAAAALALLLGTGGFMAVKESKAYAEAADFFSENGLDKEGLTRAEIKAVYRDVREETFSYSKTAEVISHSMRENEIPGYEIIEKGEELPKEMMRDIIAAISARKNAEGIRYGIRIKYVHHDEGDGWNEEVGSYAEKYDGTELLWQVTFDGIYAEKLIECEDGIAVVAVGYSGPSYVTHTTLTRIDGNGNVLWKKPLGETDETFCAALYEADGGFAVFGRKDGSFRFTRLDMDGNTVLRKVTKGFTKGILNAAHYKDGYLIQLFDRMRGEFASFAKVGADGCVTEEYSFSAKDEEYHIADMIEYGGRIYLSGYAVPYDTESEYGSPGMRDQLMPIMLYCAKKMSETGVNDIPELTRMMQEHYTAMLLRIEPEDGSTEDFCEVKGGFGGRLGVDENGLLTWEVCGISCMEYSPATNAFSFYGLARTVRYGLNAEGLIEYKLDTGEYESFVK